MIEAIETVGAVSTFLVTNVSSSAAVEIHADRRSRSPTAYCKAAAKEPWNCSSTVQTTENTYVLELAPGDKVAFQAHAASATDIGVRIVNSQQSNIVWMRQKR